MLMKMKSREEVPKSQLKKLRKDWEKSYRLTNALILVKCCQ